MKYFQILIFKPNTRNTAGGLNLEGIYNKMKTWNMKPVSVNKFHKLGRQRLAKPRRKISLLVIFRVWRSLLFKLLVWLYGGRMIGVLKDLKITNLLETVLNGIIFPIWQENINNMEVVLKLKNAWFFSIFILIIHL